MANMESSRNFVAKAGKTFADQTASSRMQGALAADAGRFQDEIASQDLSANLEATRDQFMDGVYADKGGWAYKSKEDGTIEIVSVPSTSKLKPGTVLDPKKIAAISDAGQRARAQRAYDSIQRVMSGQDPIKPAGGGKKAGPPPMPNATPSPFAGVTDRLRAGGTPDDVSIGGGVGAVEGPMSAGPYGSAADTITRGPARPPSRQGK